MKIGDREVREIIVTGKDRELIASITDDDIISKNDFNVELIPGCSHPCRQD